MGIIDELKQIPPVAEPQSSWVKDLIDKRYQPQQGRVKRTPIGFDFKRDPFDPSSYYKQLGTLRDISRSATEVTKQEVYNRNAAQLAREQAASQNAINSALKGIHANYTYDPSNGGSRNYGLKGVSSNTSAAANYFGSRYGISNIGGYREHGSVPGSDHPKGRALDFMTSNYNKGTALANDLIKNYKKWNVKYVIWYRYIWSPGRGWRKYNGPSAHTDHVHASFNK